MSELTRRGVLWLGLKCDVRCHFCYDELVPSSQKRWLDISEVTAALEKFRYYYLNDYVDFMGGEPTLHPKAIEIVEIANRLGLKPTMITHGMRLADKDLVMRYKDAGIHDFLVSVHAVGETLRTIHRRGRDNSDRQLTAMRNMREVDIPFRFNVTIVRETLSSLSDVARLAVAEGARVVNFLTFNPYFEWAEGTAIPFQVTHTEAARALMPAIDILTTGGVEANVRYMPICTMPGYESHVFTGMQLPYDVHEWDYNSWYDRGEPGVQSSEWYQSAAELQRDRHKYVRADPCKGCALRQICDGVHSQYLSVFGDGELSPYGGPLITASDHFINDQPNVHGEIHTEPFGVVGGYVDTLALTQFSSAVENRAGVVETFRPTQRSLNG